MFTRDVLNYFDITRPTLARALDISDAAVYQWKDNEPIPEAQALRLAAATGNGLRYDPELYNFDSAKLDKILANRPRERDNAEGNF